MGAVFTNKNMTPSWLGQRADRSSEVGTRGITALARAAHPRWPRTRRMAGPSCFAPINSRDMAVVQVACHSAAPQLTTAAKCGGGRRCLPHASYQPYLQVASQPEVQRTDSSTQDQKPNGKHGDVSREAAAGALRLGVGRRTPRVFALPWFFPGWILLSLSTEIGAGLSSDTWRKREAKRPWLQ